MSDIMYMIDICSMLILFLGFSLFRLFHIFIRVVYLPVLIYLMFGDAIGIMWIDILIRLCIYAIVLYVVYLKYVQLTQQKANPV